MSKPHSPAPQAFFGCLSKHRRLCSLSACPEDSVCPLSSSSRAFLCNLTWKMMVERRRKGKHCFSFRESRKRQLQPWFPYSFGNPQRRSLVGRMGGGWRRKGREGKGGEGTVGGRGRGRKRERTWEPGIRNDRSIKNLLIIRDVSI